MGASFLLLFTETGGELSIGYAPQNTRTKDMNWKIEMDQWALLGFVDRGRQYMFLHQVKIFLRSFP